MEDQKMKKKLLALLSVVLILATLVACSSSKGPAASPTTSAPSTSKPSQSAAPSAQPSTPASTDEVQLPTTGIGTSITTSVKAKEKYTIAIIVKNSTNPYMVGCLNGVKKAAEDMGFEAILMAP